MLSWLRLVVVWLALGLTVLVMAVITYPFVIAKALLNWNMKLRCYFTSWILWCGSTWLGINASIFTNLAGVKYELRVDTPEEWEALNTTSSYLIIANHQGWMDIPGVMQFLNWRILYPRFFIKSSLIWVPFFGPVWWGLDYPFLKRYSKQYLAKHPEDKGKDYECTMKALSIYEHQDVAIMCFPEGTRLDAKKHRQQNSPYRHLLLPKVGATALTVTGLGQKIKKMVDLTLVYKGGCPSMVDVCRGKLKHLLVHVRVLDLPQELLDGDYMNDEVTKVKFQNWMNETWRHKDELMTQLQQEVDGVSEK